MCVNKITMLISLEPSEDDLKKNTNYFYRNTDTTSTD